MHSPNTSDLQLRLCAQLLAFDRLIGDDGGGCAARPHVVKHHTLRRGQVQTFSSFLQKVKTGDSLCENFKIAFYVMLL